MHNLVYVLKDHSGCGMGNNLQENKSRRKEFVEKLLVSKEVGVWVEVVIGEGSWERKTDSEQGFFCYVCFCF